MNKQVKDERIANDLHDSDILNFRVQHRDHTSNNCRDADRNTRQLL